MVSKVDNALLSPAPGLLSALSSSHNPQDSAVFCGHCTDLFPTVIPMIPAASTCRRYCGILNLSVLSRCADSSIPVGQMVAGARPTSTCGPSLMKPCQFCKLETAKQSPHLLMFSS